MLAADRSLLEVNLRQSAIKLREKELNLYTENFSAMATQAAVMAGFTLTCLVELSIPASASELAKVMLYSSAIVSVCANLTCVSLSTIIIVYGSGKALRGKEGSMDEAVDAMSKERGTIFQCFAIGLLGNFATVLSTCLILMSPPLSFVLMLVVAMTAANIAHNSQRIQRSFMLHETIQLDDLTNFSTQQKQQQQQQQQQQQPYLSQQQQQQQQLIATKALIPPLMGDTRYRNKNSADMV